MDNPYVDYRSQAESERQAITWPGQRNLALVVQVHLEYWEMDPPADALKDARFVGEYGSFSPDFRTWSQREYGNRVGIFRLLEVLDRYPVKLTVPVNAACVMRHRTLIQQLAGRGAEFVGHGSHASRIVSSQMHEAQERTLIRDCICAIEQVTGERVRGWVSQDAGQSGNTPRLLAEAGVEYIMDWPNDDSPYTMKTTPELVSLPLQPEWDDVQQLWLRRIPMTTYPQMVVDAFEGLSVEPGRVMVLSLHPWLMGMAHRIRYLDTALQGIFQSSTTQSPWATTAGEVTRLFKEHVQRCAC